VKRLGVRSYAIGAIVLVAAGASVSIGACGGSSGPDTPADVLARGGSIARVTIGARALDFVVTCHDAGAGSVIAVGTGTEVDDEGHTRQTRLLVQAFLNDSYIGVTVGGDGQNETAPAPEVYEASLANVFDLVLEDDVIAADGIEFVRNLDLAQGSGESLGQGSLRVTCGSYEQGVPAGLER
jgi:hypothetical protein